MKCIVLFSSLFFTALICCAQEDTAKSAASTSQFSKYVESGMEIAGFKLPYYSDDGELLLELYGEHVRLVSDNEAHIRNLILEVYRDDEVSMTIFAPQCVANFDVQGVQSDSRQITIQSDGFVLVDSAEMTLSGRGFMGSWKNDDIHFEVLNESKILVKKGVIESEKF